MMNMEPQGDIVSHGWFLERNIGDIYEYSGVNTHGNILSQDGFLPNGETTLHTRELVIPSISKV